MDSKYSVVEYIPSDTGTSCGYCKATDTNLHMGMWAHTMTVEDYQDLLDRGWRRSGQYCYKPSLTVTCCPLYTIKCDAVNFKLSKSQKKLLKRVSKYIKEGNSKDGAISVGGDEAEGGDPAGINIFDKRMSKVIEDKSNEEMPVLIDVEMDSDNENIEFSRRLNATDDNTKSNDEERRMEIEIPPPGHELSEGTARKSLKAPRPGIGPDMAKPQCKKAKLLRLEKKHKKLEEKGISVDCSQKKELPKEKTLEDYIQESNNENSYNKLELRLVRSNPWNSKFEETFKAEYALYQKYQMAIHNDSIKKCTENQFTRFLVSSPLKIRLVPSKLGKEYRMLTWKLFVKYQTIIHKETPDENDYGVFQSFLMATPLQMQKSLKGPHCGYGSFHQQYWLNDKLIAVGVIDILPKCLSSVYFFYDPDYSFLSLGTYGSLRELEFLRCLYKNTPDICNYYMGYYIHSCPKMRYKARYNPSYLLCPEAYTWHPVVNCQKKLDISKYSRFNEDIDVICEDSYINLTRVLILWQKIAMPYSSYKARCRSSTDNEDEEVREYAELVGRKCAEKMLLYRH